MRSKIETSMRGWIFLLVFMSIISIICSLGMSSVDKVDKHSQLQIHQIAEIHQIAD